MYKYGIADKDKNKIIPRKKSVKTHYLKKNI
jgi:hypothetical protein